MIVKIIGALVIIGFFLVLNKAGSAFLEKGNLLSKLFPIGSALLGAFLIGLIFLG